MKQDLSYEDWLEQQAQKDVMVVQLRMMSSGNELIGKPPAYGVYFAEKESDDEIKRAREASAMSSLGGGFCTTAPIEFHVKQGDTLCVVRRTHNSDQWGYAHSKTVGSSFSLKGSDKVAYQKAHKAASKIARMFRAKFVDKTSQDLSEHSDCLFLDLENRVYNYNSRVQI